jgi:hypothetical protein
MRKIHNFLIIFVAVSMFVPTIRADDKHPDRKARDQYAKQFASDMEHDGWQGEASAMRPGCGMVCFNRGNHDCLQVTWSEGTVEAVDRFVIEEIGPRMPQLRKLGFVEVDILGLNVSNTYPRGEARFPFINP